MESPKQQNQNADLQEEIFYQKFTQPFCLSKIVYDRSLIVLLIGFIIAIISGIIVVSVEGIKVTNFKSQDLFVNSDAKIKRQASFDVGMEEVDKWRTNKMLEDDPDCGGQHVRSQLVDEETTLIVYHNEHGNVFTPENVNNIIRIEQELFKWESGKLFNLCKAQSETNNSCAANAFYALSAYMKFNWTQEEINGFLYMIANSPLYETYKVLFGTDYTADHPQTNIARSVFKFGFPLEVDGKRFKDKYDDFDGQDEIYCKFFFDFYEWLEDQQTDTMKLCCSLNGFKGCSMNLCFICFYSYLYDGSHLIMTLSFSFSLIFNNFKIGMLQIIMSLPIAFFTNRYIFGVRNFSSMNLIVLFLILGISADNIFIYVDTWKQSSQIKYIKNDLNKRFVFTYKKAIRQITTTQATTAFNFLMTATTPIMLISSFGYFAISLVIWNYILVLSFYPACFLILVKLLMKRKEKKLENQQEEKELGKLQIEAKVPEIKVPEINIPQSEKKLIDNYDNCPEISPSEEREHHDKKRIINESPLSMKLQNAFEPDIQQNFGDIEVQQEFSENYVIQKKEQEISQRVETDANLKQQEMEKEIIIEKDSEEPIHQEKYNIIERFFYEKYSPKLYKFWYIVLIVFISWFAVTVYFTSQLQAPKEVTQTAPESNILRKGKDHLLDFHSGKNDNVLKVFMVWGISGINRDTIDNKWDSNDKGSTIWDDTFDLSKESTQARILEICQDLRINYVGGDLVQDDGLDCFMESFRSFVQDTNNKTFPVPQEEFFAMIDNYTSNNLTGKQYLNNHYLGIIDKKVKYIQITLYGKTYLILQRKEQEPLFEKWESIMHNYNKNSPETCNKGLQTAGLGWQWMVTEKKLIDQTIVSLICTMSFAFFVLTCSTLNWLISLYSTMSIIGIVIGILALIKLFGWYLGLIESIAAGIVVGFSVEYIVFLCINFLIVDYKTRYLKMQRSLLNMGISIIGGAITTLGAGLFLIFGQMDFFPKMGKLLMCTIAFSILWSLCFFSALCMVAGPMGNTGSIAPYCKCIADPCSKKKKQ